MSIANYFTFIRILIGPIFLFIYLYYPLLGLTSVTLPYALLSLLAISELSDACDGFLARRYDQVTDLGKILDPMADSISRTSIFLTLTMKPIELPIPLIFVFLYRDSMVSTLRTICAFKGFALAARSSGKIKAAIQAAAAFTCLILLIPYESGNLSVESLHFYATGVVSLAALYTLYSGIDYFYANRHYIKLLLTLAPKTIT